MILYHLYTPFFINVNLCILSTFCFYSDLWKHIFNRCVFHSMGSCQLFSHSLLMDIQKSHFFTVSRKVCLLVESQLLWRLRQKDHKFEASLGNLVKSCLKLKQQEDWRIEISGRTLAWHALVLAQTQGCINNKTRRLGELIRG